MLSILGFCTILSFLILIFTRKMSVITALVMVPLLAGILAGFSMRDLSEMMFTGIKQVAPTGILLIFAILYFAVMLDAGLFDPLITAMVRQVKGDPLKVILGTAVLTMLVHLDGDGTATFMIVLSAFLPIYKILKIDKLVLAGIVALSVGPLHLVPWSGTSARAIAVLNTDAVHIFNPNIPSIMAGIAWVLLVAYIFGKKERARLGIVSLNYDLKANLDDEQRRLRRPNRVLINGFITVFLILTLMTGKVAAPVLFMVAGLFALWINYPNLNDQQKILKSHGANIFLVSSLIFAAGIFSGILTGSKMIDAMAGSLVDFLPPEFTSLLPVLTALTSMPASLVFTPDAYYFGVVPVLSAAAEHYQIDPLEIGRAALLGQMTVGFPLSPLTASTFLLTGLCEVELGDHQKFIFKWAFGTTVIMTLMALLSGSIHL